MSDVPDDLASEVFIVTRGGSDRWALLMCPCGCGQRLAVNLMQTIHPHWRLSIKRGKASLDPSIWVAPHKCGSHFWLVDNRVLWCSYTPNDSQPSFLSKPGQNRRP